MHETDLEPDIGPTDFGISRMPPDFTRNCAVGHALGLGWPSIFRYIDVLGDYIPDGTSPFFKWNLD